MGCLRSRAAKRMAIERSRQVVQEALRVQRRRQWKTQTRRKNRALERARLEAARSELASHDNSRFLDSICMERVAALHAGRLAFTLIEQTSAKGYEYQKKVLQKFLDMPMLQHIMPTNVVQRKELQSCRAVCHGLAEAWKELKYGKGKDQMLARNVIEAAVISIDDDKCLKAAARCIGFNKKTLRRAVSRRHDLNNKTAGSIWAKGERARRRDALDQSVVDLVTSWWTEETRVSPCEKDVKRKLIGVKHRIEHAAHFLEESQVTR
jgi:predicted ATPase